ncbi:MAG: succinylglutamate desuccinylase/aspartoacylase family protein [Myxococcales bacterium]|nr:succinylglutamate desuccinylase/aspartoacylase family protein [Myxococcales bacterium]
MTERILGAYETGRPGPTVVVVGAIHGNEPSGLLALERVLTQLRRAEVPLRGRFLALVGNARAHAAGERYLQRDLNRDWVPDAVDALRARDPALDGPEDHEQRALLAVLDPLLAQAAGPMVFLDLHSMSSHGPPFAVLGDTLRNRTVALSLCIPTVLGLDETIDGTLMSWLVEQGHVGVGVEAGQHDDPASIDVHTSIVWLALEAAGAVDEDCCPWLPDHRRSLRGHALELPPVLEIRHRQRTFDGDGFVMRPGFRNFDRVTKGQPLADDAEGVIEATLDGHVMLPRYQPRGDDGFFLATPVRPFWLDLSARLRRGSLERWITHLPGVHPHPERPDHYVVDPGMARHQVVNLFHLFGYRRRHAEGERLVFSRRRPDHGAPAPDAAEPGPIEGDR